MSITLKQLRHIDALARARNFREAAKSLGISQPALTQSIRALEQHLGCALLDRLPGGTELTTAGQRVVGRARQLLPQVHALEQEVAAAVRVTEGTLAIAAGSYPGYMLVPNTIAAMSHNVADLSVRYHEASWMNFCSLLTNREVDVAVGDIGGLREDPRLQTERLDEDLLYYFCRSGHPLSGHQGVSLQDIRAFPLAGNSAPPHIARLLGRDQRTGTRDEVTGLFHPRFTLTTLAAVKRIVGSTDAISLAPLSLLEADLRSGALAVIHCAGAQPSLNTGIVHLAGRALNPVAAAFVRELKHQSSSMRACSARLKKQLGLTPQGG